MIVYTIHHSDARWRSLQRALPKGHRDQRLLTLAGYPKRMSSVCTFVHLNYYLMRTVSANATNVSVCMDYEAFLCRLSLSLYRKVTIAYVRRAAVQECSSIMTQWRRNTFNNVTKTHISPPNAFKSTRNDIFTRTHYNCNYLMRLMRAA